VRPLLLPIGRSPFLCKHHPLLIFGDAFNLKLYHLPFCYFCKLRNNLEESVDVMYGWQVKVEGVLSVAFDEIAAGALEALPLISKAHQLVKVLHSPLVLNLPFCQVSLLGFIIIY
jgi:hypothetical protein